MKIRLSLTNKTGWDTRDLRRAILAAIDVYDAPGYLWRVKIAPAGQRRSCTGLAYRGTGSMRINIPNPHLLKTDMIKAVIVHDFFCVVDHEIRHCLGQTHGEMNKEGYNCRIGPAPEWSDGLLLRPKAVKKKVASTPAERAAKREAHARRMLAKAEYRFKLANSIAKKWRRRVSYYDRKGRAAAGGKP